MRYLGVVLRHHCRESASQSCSILNAIEIGSVRKVSSLVDDLISVPKDLSFSVLASVLTIATKVSKYVATELLLELIAFVPIPSS